jgi:hypothetical protein
VEAPLLLVHDRFDIAIKAMYARLWLTDRGRTWRDYAYYHQAVRITGPGREVVEHDGSGKSGLEQFKETFHSLLKKLEPDEIPTVPVDDRWCAFDGAHRIAAAIATQRNVKLAKIHSPSTSFPSAAYFSNKTHGHTPLPREVLDEGAIEYCRIKSGLVLALIFPTVVSEHFAVDQLKMIGEIIYRKDIEISPSAGAGLLKQAYLGHQWAHDSENSPGFIHKVKSCFPFRGVLRAILLDNCNPLVLRDVKDSIRSHYRVGNHSIHCTDGDDEVLRLARVVFNENSLAFLRMGVNASEAFHQRLFVYRDWIEKNMLDEEAFCVDGGSILGLMGLRESRDLDFLYDGDSSLLPDTPPKVDNHNEISGFYSHSVSDIVGDPRLHGWYMGVKFCNPVMVAEMKRQRNETKDRVDIMLLDSRLPAKHHHRLHLLFRIKARTNSFVLASLAQIQAQIRSRLKLVLKKILGGVNS